MIPLKDRIIHDLHKILFGTTIESDKASWELPVIMAKAIINHHKLYFKDRCEIPDSKYWNIKDTEDYFFDFMCPGIVPTETAFAFECNRFFDWNLFERKQPIGKVFDEMENAINKLRELEVKPDFHFPSHLELPTAAQLNGAYQILSSPKNAA